MKPAALLLLAAAFAWPQAQSLRIAPSTFSRLEKSFDVRLEKASADPMMVLGATRAVYLEGYGVVFTTEVDLIQTPGMQLMFGKMTPEDVGRIHGRKAKNVAALKSAMTEMIKTAAGTLLQIPVDQKVIVAVRMLYMPWENTAGLPSQIVMTATRAEAAENRIKVDEQ